MRVLVVGLNYAPEPTGIAPYTSAFCRGLRARGHDVRVLTSMPHYPNWRVQDSDRQWRRRDTVDGVPVLRLKHYVPARPNGLRRLLSEVSFGLHVGLSHWGRPDLVVFVSPALVSSAMAILLRRPRQPHVVWVQDVYSLGIKETGRGGVVSRAFYSLESKLFSRATGVAVIHERFAGVVRGMGALPSRVRVIRNWTHLPARQPTGREAARAALGVASGRLIVLHSGAMGRKQDLGNVVAAARLAAQQQSPVQFVLVGGGGERARLEAEAQGIDTISFIDPLPRDAFQDALAAADVLLVNEHAGLREMAVPSKLTSYFSSGRPVVAATDAESVTAEELKASGGGVRVDPGKPQALLDAVTLVAKDAELAERYGLAGQEYQRSVLSEDAALDRFTAWLEDLAGFARRTPVDLLRERFREPSRR